MSINSQIKEQASVDASESKNKNAHNDNSDNGNNPNNNNENNNNENKVQNAYIRIGVYDIIKTIGHGNFSVCKLAQHKCTNQKFAIKCIQKKNLDSYNLTRVYREIEIMKSLDHPNIIKLHQVMESKSMLYLVCDYAEQGEIFDYILKNGAMSEKLACQKFCQIISAVEYCHLKNIAHRDLKSENLLLDKNMNIKLADFGFSNYFDLSNPLKTFCGSPPYAAPEIFNGKKYYGPEIDIWSLGVILYVLVSGSLPFDSENLQTLKQKITNCKYKIPFHVSQDCENLISKILVVNPSKRFKLQQIKTHKWIKINSNTSYLHLLNVDKTTLDTRQSSAASAVIETKKPKLRKFNRISNRFKSKSLKNIPNKESNNKNNLLSHVKCNKTKNDDESALDSSNINHNNTNSPNLNGSNNENMQCFHKNSFKLRRNENSFKIKEKPAMSYLSLPLYSYQQSHLAAPATPNENVQNMYSSDKKPTFSDCNSDISSKLASMNLYSQQNDQLDKSKVNNKFLKSPAFSKLVSDSSSFDEGVESDYSSPISSSFSNDFISTSITSSSITSCLNSFESKSSQTNPFEGCSKYYFESTKSAAGIASKKQSLPTSSMNLIKKYKLSNLKKAFMKSTSSNKIKSSSQSNNLRSLKNELHVLMSSNDPSINLSEEENSQINSFYAENDDQNLGKNLDFNAQTFKTKNIANCSIDASKVEHSNQKLKQFIFFKHCKKRQENSDNNNINNIENVAACEINKKLNKKSLFRQKSISLNSLYDDENTFNNTIDNRKLKINMIEKLDETKESTMSENLNSKKNDILKNRKFSLKN